MSNQNRGQSHTPDRDNIDEAGALPVLGHMKCAAMALLSSLLVWAAFPPLDIGLAAWIALAPLLFMSARAGAGKRALWSFISGWLLFIALIYWLGYVTIAGWIAMAAYCAVYPMTAAIVLGWLKRKGLPLLITTPLVWTALEFARSNLLTGFGFVFLSHTQHKYLPVMQIADICGAYGVTFVLAAVNGALADVLLAGFRPRKKVIIEISAAGLIVLATLGYGFIRLGSIKMTPGPKLALIQANVPLTLKHSPSYKDALDVLDRHVRLTESLKEKPDLVVWAETMFPAPLNLCFDDELLARALTSDNADTLEIGRFYMQSLNRLIAAVRVAGAPMIVGAETYDLDSRKHYNSAYLISPQGRPLGRYNKIHLVIFGEYTPLTNIFPFLKALRPEIMGPDLSFGQLRQLFKIDTQNDGPKDFGVTICYEDAEEGLFRRFVQDGAQFMLNITNDGWFGGSTELDEHLIVSQFRAVENRVPLARCTNNGISAIIAPTGKVTDRLVDAQGRDRNIEGALTGTLMMADSRSLYTRFGDVLAWICLAGSIAVLFIRPARPRRDKAVSGQPNA